MLYTASYFEPANHHGALISVSRSRPKSFKVDSTLSFLAPSQALLQDWKSGITEAEYTDRYRGEIKTNWDQVQGWMVGLIPQIDQTLLCWERTGEFCHRNMIAKLVEHYRGDCFGGCDVELKPSSDRAYYEWFLAQSDSNLPRVPFQLTRAVTVSGELFYESLRGEVNSSLEFLRGDRAYPSARHCTESLQSIVRRLWELTR